MSYPDNTGRNYQLQRGNPASGSNPVRGNHSGSRNNRRAFEFQQQKAFGENWAEGREFEDRPVKPRGQTNRSTAWKSKFQDKKKIEKKDDPSTSYDFRSKEDTAPIDEPLYDLGPHSSSIPVQENYSQNFDFSGYIDQVERSYEAMRGIDPRLDRRMPFSMFQHSMCTILNCYLVDLAQENGERKMGVGKCQDLLPEDLCVPENLFHYLANVGNTTTVNGEEIKFNLPEIAVPRPQEGDFPAGSFGPVNAENHNVYECYISPLVTMNRVLNSRRAQGVAEVPPLPVVMAPHGGIPTENLLGHGPPDIIHIEARQRIEGFEFPEGDSEAARLRLCPELMARVNTVLFEMRTRFKMRDIGRQSPSLRNYVKPKNIPGYVQYVRVAENVPDNQRLSKRQSQIRGPAAFGSATSGQVNLHCLHRERTNHARGACYTVGGAIPNGWNATINSNFHMAAPFLPTIGVNNAAIRLLKFISHAPGGLRTSAIDNYIKRNFYLPAK